MHGSQRSVSPAGAVPGRALTSVPRRPSGSQVTRKQGMHPRPCANGPLPVVRLATGSPSLARRSRSERRTCSVTPGHRNGSESRMTSTCRVAPPAERIWNRGQWHVLGTAYRHRRRRPGYGKLPCYSTVPQDCTALSECVRFTPSTCSVRTSSRTRTQMKMLR